MIAMAPIGIIVALFGFWIMSLARKTEGVSGALLFLIGLGLLIMGLYLALFESGSGAARWAPWLARR
jgi:sulfite exporter TauE/SafE